MSLNGWFFAATYDRQLRKVEQAGLRQQRAALLAQARGDVLEIGGGTGLNLPHYGERIGSLTITDPERPMLKRLERRAQGLSPLTKVLCAPAEDLPFADDSFDTVVSSLVLCTVADQPRALREIRRVLRPGGSLLFLEHVRSDEPKIARRQDRMNGLSRMVMHGCNCNRPTLSQIEAAGFEIPDVRHDTLAKAPSFVSPLIIGTATPAAIATGVDGPMGMQGRRPPAGSPAV
jgi:ubiquinone/menaquinone biosynthesis C-methylase UbiE